MHLLQTLPRDRVAARIAQHTVQPAFRAERRFLASHRRAEFFVRLFFRKPVIDFRRCKNLQTMKASAFGTALDHRAVTEREIVRHETLGIKTANDRLDFFKERVQPADGGALPQRIRAPYR